MKLDYWNDKKISFQPFRLQKHKNSLSIISPFINFESRKTRKKINKRYNNTAIYKNRFRNFRRNLKEPFIYENCIFCNNLSNVFHHENKEIWNFGYFMCYYCHNKYHRDLKNV